MQDARTVHVVELEALHLGAVGERGVRRGEPGPAAVLPIPDDIWNGVRRDNVHDTYRDVFRNTDAMTRAWITAISEGGHVRPDFSDGLAVQRVVDAAVDSAGAGGLQVRVVTESLLDAG